MRAPSPLFLQLVLLLAVALAAGGGGVGAAGGNLAVQLAAIGLLAWNGPAIGAVLGRASRPLTILLALTVAVPLVQIIPLPPVIWQALPGRGLEQESLALVGQAQSWRPISVAPARTILGFLGLIAPVTALLLAVRVTEKRDQMLMLVVIGGIVVVLLGGVQMASGGTVGMIYAEDIGSSELFGTFANRNTSGLFLVLALTALISRGRFERGKFLNPSTIAGIGLGAVFCFAIILSHSRSAMALMLIPILYLASRALPGLRAVVARQPRAILLVLAPAFLVIVAAVGLLVQGNDRIHAAVARFDDLQAVRLWIWDDTTSSVKRFWPVGAGVGTFDEVFQIDESIEYLEPPRAGRAHDELLEQAVESGIVGLALSLAWLGWLGATTFRALAVRNSPGRSAAAIMLCCIAFQSVLDYPLRNQTILCTAAMLVAILIGKSRSAGIRSGSDGLARDGNRA